MTHTRARAMVVQPQVSQLEQTPSAFTLTKLGMVRDEVGRLLSVIQMRMGTGEFLRASASFLQHNCYRFLSDGI